MRKLSSTFLFFLLIVLTSFIDHRTFENNTQLCGPFITISNSYSGPYASGIKRYYLGNDPSSVFLNLLPGQSYYTGNNYSGSTISFRLIITPQPGYIKVINESTGNEVDCIATYFGENNYVVTVPGYNCDAWRIVLTEESCN